MDPGLYPHRGFMLDTGRKFFPVQAITKLLTLLQRYNFNVFHWHIYDAESFPLLWPEYQKDDDMTLTKASQQFSHSREYYSPQDIRYIVIYAERLGIRVYPETDMPGHCDIWGFWKKDLVIGNPNLKHPNAQLDIRKPMTHDYIHDLVSTVDRYFLRPDLHHFGGDEVALIWQTENDRKLLARFFEWLRIECCGGWRKTLIMWDDPITEPGNVVNEISTDWVIQTWHAGVTQSVLEKGYRVIVSESETFYIGNADCEKIKKFVFPADEKVLGFEVIWFTSEKDDPFDLEQDWIVQPLRAAAEIRRSPC